MAQSNELSGRELMSEMSHTLAFLNAMGYDTQDITNETYFELRNEIRASTAKILGERQNEIKDAFI